MRLHKRDLLVSLFVIGSTIALFSLPSKPSEIIRGGADSEEGYTLVLDDGKQPTLSAGAGTLEAKHSGAGAIKIDYGVASIPLEGHITLADGGYIQDHGRFLGLTDVIIIGLEGSGSLKLSYGVSTRTAHTVAITSENLIVSSLVANHFKLFAEGGSVTIEALSLKYTCATGGVPVQSVTISGDSYIVEGEDATLTATLNPVGATDNEVTWSSSNPSIATVNSAGKVTGVSAGDVTITATADGKSATRLVHIMELPVNGDMGKEEYTEPFVYSNTEFSNNVSTSTKTFFGNAGVYMSIDVEDSSIGSISRLEVGLMLGSKATIGSTWQIRFYAGASPAVKKYVFKSPGSDGWAWNENTSLDIQGTVTSTGTGYTAEAYFPYNTLGAVAPESIRIQPSIFFYIDAAKSGNRGRTDGTLVTNFTSWASEFYHKFDNEGYIDDFGINNPDVEIKYDGSITNSGSNASITASAKKLNQTSNATSFVDATSTATYVADRFGAASKALQSNSRNGAYALVEGFELGSRNWAMSTWIYTTSGNLSTGNSSPIFASRKVDKITIPGEPETYTYPKGFRLTLRNDGAFKFNYAYTNKDGATLGGVSQLSYGAWHHLVVTRIAEKAYIFVNGVQVNEMPINTPLVIDLGDNPISFGAYLGETWQYQNGNISFDDTLLFSKGISADRALELYNTQKPV